MNELNVVCLTWMVSTAPVCQRHSGRLDHQLAQMTDTEIRWLSEVETIRMNDKTNCQLLIKL